MPALQHLNAICSPVRDKSMSNACYSYMREISQRQDLMQPLISDPASLSTSDLKTLWGSLYRGTKWNATMAMDFFSANGLKFHTLCPAQVVFLVLAEKKEQRPDLTELIDKVKAEPSYGKLHYYHAFEARVECMKLGLTTMDALKTAAAKAEKSCPFKPSNFMAFCRRRILWLSVATILMSLCIVRGTKAFQTVTVVVKLLQQSLFGFWTHLLPATVLIKNHRDCSFIPFHSLRFH